jgi:hypothetical protein
MKFTYLIAVVMLLLACSPVAAAVGTFQDFSGGDIILSAYSITTAAGGSTYNGTAVRDYVGNGGSVYITDSAKSKTTYFAADFWVGGFTYPSVRIDLYDENLVIIGTAGSVGVIGGDGDHPLPVRAEVKIESGIPKLYLGGVYSSSGAAITKNPTYYKLTNIKNPPTSVTTVYIDNIVVGGLDHHVIGSIPPNWSVQRDLINPASTGVYAWNPNTGEWAVQSSYYFQIDANKEGTALESVLITRVSDGTIVSSKPVTASRNRIEYSVASFFADAPISDGLYSVGFSGSSNIEHLWVISNGAVINLNKDAYLIGDTATFTYVITPPAYYDIATYDYSYKVINVYGQEIATGNLPTSTGSGSFTFQSSLCNQGVYFIELIATNRGDFVESVMAYDTASVYEYVAVAGTVMDAETTLPLVGANVNITQATVVNNLTSAADGTYATTTDIYAGDVIIINATKSGYLQYVSSFTPLSAGTKAVNISLIPNPPTSVGVSIGGIVRDNVYNNPISGVTVTVRNIPYGSYATATTNIAGFYRVDNLVSGRFYDIWSSKAGYANSTSQSVMAVGA